MDQTNFVLAQLAFWLLAATDGHGKNFSLHHRTGGTYGMTPLYDVLSAWPIIGHGKNQLAIDKAKLAMSLRGRRAHYRLNRDHRPTLAGTRQQRTADRDLWRRMQSFVEAASAALERVEKRLPRTFPERVYVTIRDGVRVQAQRFTQTSPDGCDPCAGGGDVTALRGYQRARRTCVS